MPPCVSAESRRTAADLIRQTLRASKAPGRPVRFGSLLPSVPHVPRISPQHPLQLLGRHPSSEASPHVLLGSRDERSPETLVQTGAAFLALSLGHTPSIMGLSYGA